MLILRLKGSKDNFKDFITQYTEEEKGLVSLGQVVAREAHRGQGEWAYQQALAGVPLDQLLACIAA
ncbi:MAG: hypothetical protein HXX08_06895 [Chloroflexi bacterium]|uniref:Uncharacterized protein n=1 Tax=Candidatus Chlorohelix allophototropha TaxID=3003348 RepID=A0A8T7LU74_9CHLR|nr:hypothetical protein [Chloroflexota bacterium]WJW67461.1 hypothetical protein OZ401_000727 [Chloroflexota bacterium L227-S17]